MKTYENKIYLIFMVVLGILLYIGSVQAQEQSKSGYVDAQIEYRDADGRLVVGEQPVSINWVFYDSGDAFVFQEIGENNGSGNQTGNKNAYFKMTNVGINIITHRIRANETRVFYMEGHGAEDKLIWRLHDTGKKATIEGVSYDIWNFSGDLPQKKVDAAGNSRIVTVRKLDFPCLVYGKKVGEKANITTAALAALQTKYNVEVIITKGKHITKQDGKEGVEMQ